jgi:hypothetical protein
VCPHEPGRMDPGCASLVATSTTNLPPPRPAPVRLLHSQSRLSTASCLSTAAFPPSQTAKQRKAAEEEARRLGIAPSSLYEGDNLPAIAAVEYIYRPKMKELLAFELPSNLALPAIADIALQVRVCVCVCVCVSRRQLCVCRTASCVCRATGTAWPRVDRPHACMQAGRTTCIQGAREACRAIRHSEEQVCSLPSIP